MQPPPTIWDMNDNNTVSLDVIYKSIISQLTSTTMSNWVAEVNVSEMIISDQHFGLYRIKFSSAVDTEHVG